MSIIKVISVNSAGGTLKYLIDEKAHNKELTADRSLLYSGQNVETDYQKKMNAQYLTAQYWAVRQQAKHPSKTTQGHHLIISFSEAEFPIDENHLQQQALQAEKLVNGFLQRQLPKQAQYLVAIQRDSEGHNLHAHVLINSVMTNGKVLNTNLVSVTNHGTRHGLRSQFDQYLTENFERVTDRPFTPIKPDKENLVHSSAAQLDRHGRYIWKEDLKERITEAFNKAVDLVSLKQILATEHHVQVKERRAAIGKDRNGKKIYRPAFTYRFTDQDGHERSARDFAYGKNGALKGLGAMFSPAHLLEAFRKREEEYEYGYPTQTITDGSRATVAEKDSSTSKPTTAGTTVNTTIDRLKRAAQQRTQRAKFNRVGRGEQAAKKANRSQKPRNSIYQEPRRGRSR